jgi:hypothetical protein
VVAAFAFAPATAFGARYPVPKVKGGSTTRSATKKVAKAVQNTTEKKLAKGLKVKVHFPAAGTITVTVKGPGTSGTGQATSSKAGTKTIDVTFSKLGAAGSTVTVTVSYKPSGKKGKASTSTSSVKLG